MTQLTHPVVASLDLSLFGFAAKRVKKIKTPLYAQRREG
jgi:hypothetical protein